jgi:cytidine deaminase
MKKQVQFTYEEYATADDLTEADAALLTQARAVTENAYAPYSQFRVGAAARLVNREVITGTNQENASYPAGICAERTLLSVAGSLFPGIAIDTLAVSYHNGLGNSDRPISPCGICRQSLQEFEGRTGKPVRMILSGQTGKIIILEQAGHLLPFAFSANELK